jgi:hypothetical protein
VTERPDFEAESLKAAVSSGVSEAETVDVCVSETADVGVSTESDAVAEAKVSETLSAEDRLNVCWESDSDAVPSSELLRVEDACDGVDDSDDDTLLVRVQVLERDDVPSSLPVADANLSVKVCESVSGSVAVSDLDSDSVTSPDSVSESVTT